MSKAIAGCTKGKPGFPFVVSIIDMFYGEGTKGTLSQKESGLENPV